MEVSHRLRIERSIVDRVVDALLAAGYSIDVLASEQRVAGCAVREDSVARSRDAAAIKNDLMTTDEDDLVVYRDGRRSGQVKFVYGNDGWDVINDYTTNLEEVLGPVCEYCEKEELAELADAPKPANRLFMNVADTAWRQCFTRLLELRTQHPTYRDDELLMYTLCEDIQKRSA